MARIYQRHPNSVECFLSHSAYASSSAKSRKLTVPLQRFVAGTPLNGPERETFYSDGPQGYIDYPVLEQTR